MISTKLYYLIILVASTGSLLHNYYLEERMQKGVFAGFGTYIITQICWIVVALVTVYFILS